MANDKGAKRLTAPLFSTYGDFAVDTHLKALRIHHFRSLGSIPLTNTCARTIHLTRGLSLFQKLEIRERNLTRRPNFGSLTSLIKVFY